MVSEQAYLFFIFIANGIFIGILFDFFRVLRKSFKTRDFVTYVEDFLFWILTGISILYLIFVFNHGEIRLFMFLAIGIGIIFYMLLFSSYFIKINVTMITFLKKILGKIFKILFIPFQWIYKILKKSFFNPISFVFINLRKFSTTLCHNTLKNIKNHKKIENNVKN